MAAAQDKKTTSQSRKPEEIMQKTLNEIKAGFADRHHDFLDWMKQHELSLEDVRLMSQQVLAAISFAGSVALNTPQESQKVQQVQALETEEDRLLASVSAEEHEAIMEKMRNSVQLPAGHLERDSELYLEQQLSSILGFEVVAELEGQRLNHTIGIMGGEQHLRRFPQDSVAQHDAYQEAGIAPNRGAFGWFTEGGELTEQAIQREKYYFAVQTLYLPEWNTQYQTLKPWYKFRKMVVINPAENKAVVGVVGDAGPAAWVQKQFGGSPEVIREGKIWSPKARGRVMLFFVDDPNDEVPLGPIDLEYGQKLAAAQ